MSRWFTGLSIRAKIALGFTLVLLALAGVAVKTTISLVEAGASFDTYRELSRTSSAVAEVNAQQSGSRIAAESYILTGDDSHLRFVEERFAAAVGAYEDARQVGQAPEIAALLDGVRPPIDAYQRYFLEIRATARGETAEYERLRDVGRDALARIAEVEATLDARRDALGPVVDAAMDYAAQVAIWITAVSLVVGAAIAACSAEPSCARSPGSRRR